MGDLQVSSLVINSHKGPYTVTFYNQITEIPLKHFRSNYFFVIDQKVFSLYFEIFSQYINKENSVLINATEEEKDLSKAPSIIEQMIEKGVKRNYTLVGIGGGITQDLTCFVASTLFRGMDWIFIPTTLLAIADSCIGSKSSINVCGIKNLVGTFYPPKAVHISADFLNTLSASEIISGIGEMVKVHLIEGPHEFKKIKGNYEKILSDKTTLTHFVRRSLEIKKRVIEIDEFDQDYRNIMNYGHTFGHALESATQYLIPHGISVAIGIDMANFTSYNYNLISKEDYLSMHELLSIMLKDYKSIPISTDIFFSSIQKDKKNIGSKITLILPHGNNCEIKKTPTENNLFFREICINYFNEHQFKLK